MIFRVTQGTLEILTVGGGSPGILSLRTAEPWRKNLGLGSDRSGFESCQCDLEQVSRPLLKLRTPKNSNFGMISKVSQKTGTGTRHY